MNAAETTSPLNTIFIGLGSNIAPEVNIPRAITLLREHCQVQLISHAWETPPKDGSGPNFINLAVKIISPLSAEQLRQEVLRPLEARMGRLRTADKNAPRTIDFDILIFNQQVEDPEIWEQVHKAVPLAELCPEFARPGSKKPIQEIADELYSQVKITPRPEVVNFPL